MKKVDNAASGGVWLGYMEEKMEVEKMKVEKDVARQRSREAEKAKAKAKAEAKAKAARARLDKARKVEGSFVAYSSFLQTAYALLLDGKRGRDEALGFFFALFDYAILGDEPTGLPPAVEAAWLLAKPQIDANARRRTKGERGGRLKESQSEQEAAEEPTADDEKTADSHNANQWFSGEEPNVNVNVNENENENVNVNVNVNENVRGASAPADQTQTQTQAQAFGSSFEKPAQAEAEQMAALSISGPQTELAKQLHALYVSEGLPCEKAFPSFLQGEFTRALRVLHGQLRDYHVGSDALLAAVRNYASVVKDPGDYYDLRLPLDRLVAKPQFVDFLPASFVKANWRRRGTAAPVVDGADSAALGLPAWASGDPMWCPGCGQKAAYWYRAKMRYVCTSCKGAYDDDTTERLYRAKRREEEEAREKLVALQKVC